MISPHSDAAPDPAGEAAAPTAPVVAAAPPELPAADTRPAPRRVLPLAAALAGAAALLVVGGAALSNRNREPPPRRQLLARGDVEAQRPVRAPQPEMPTLLVGPPRPPAGEMGPPKPDAGPMRVPAWNHGPLPAISGSNWPGALPPLPASGGPAVPTLIVPRNQDGSLPAPVPPQPARSAVTSQAKPLRLTLALAELERSLQGPGTWLKIHAAASVPCYVTVFHVDARRMVSVVFPKRFAQVYRPSNVYKLVDPEESPDSAQFVFAIASVFPLTAADALAALELQPPALPAGLRGDGATAGAMAVAYEAVLNHLRNRAGADSALKEWERHTWRTVLGVLRPKPEEPAPREPVGETKSGQPGEKPEKDADPGG